jgi:hypothetical protein
MPTPVREVVVEALRSVVAGVMGTAVGRNQRHPASGDALPYAAIMTGEQTRDDNSAFGTHRYQLEVAIILWVRGTDDAAADQALNTQYAAIMDAINAQPTLGVAHVIDTVEQTFVAEQDRDGMTEHMAGGALTVLIDYQTASTSIQI